MKKRKRLWIAILAAGILLLGSGGAYYLHGSRSNGVLMYHAVSELPAGTESPFFVSPEELETQLAWISRRRIPTGFVSTYGREPEGTLYLTFDDGYEDFYTNAFPLLRQYGIKATVFLITDYIGESGYLTEAQIRELDASGLVEFGSHTLSHPHLSSLSDDDLARELTASKARIEQILGHPISSLCYPHGDADRRVRRAAAEYYDAAFTTRAPMRWERLTGEDRYAVGRWGVPGKTTEADFAAAAGR